MTSPKVNAPRRKARPAPRRTSRSRYATLLMVGAVIAGVVLVGVGLLLRGGKASSPARAGIVMTGQMNAMGMPVIETTGSASGTASAGGVQVSGSNWALGTVPLKVAVRPAWTLINNSNQPVTLGEPVAEVRKGCCPGPFTVGKSTLGPGESTTITFELSMHPGMDGWHDIAVHVPVTTSGGEQTLTLDVTGDFRD